MMESMLSNRLIHYKGSDAILIGIRPEGIQIVTQLAEELSIDWVYIPFKNIVDPCDEHKSLGAVFCDSVYFKDSFPTLHQQYVSRQIEMFKTQCKEEMVAANGEFELPSLKERPVIIVDRDFSCVSGLKACLMFLKKYNPVSTSLICLEITTEVLNSISGMVDEIKFLHICQAYEASETLSARQQTNHYHNSFHDR